MPAVNDTYSVVAGQTLTVGVPYDLSGFSIPHTVTWPAPPTTTSTINVAANNGAQLAAAVQTAGARVVVPAGTYSANLNFYANDVDLVMDNAAFVTGTATFSDNNGSRSNRVRWTGGNLTGGLQLNHSNDILVNDVYFTTTNFHNEMSGWSDPLGTDNGWNRIAFINTTINNVGGTSGAGDWAWFNQGYTTYGDETQTDLILANVKFLTNGGQNNRFQRVTRAVVVDSAFNPDFASANGFRTNYPNYDWYMDNCVINEGWIMNHTALDMVRGHFKNIDRYHLNDGFSTFYNFADNLSANTGSVENIRGFGQSGWTPSPPASPGGFGGLTDLGGHSTAYHSYAGSSVPSLPDGTLITAVGAIR